MIGRSPTISSIEESLKKAFQTQQEKNVRVDRKIHYRFGYGADLETLYLTDKVKLVGIMFCHPDSEISSKQIIPRLEYLQNRSGEHTDLFWGGYEPFMEGHVPSEVRVVKVVGGTVWGFSEAAFNSFRAEIEGRTTWKYSGETDLLLVTARFDQETKKPYLDFSETLVCDLDRMLRQGAITSVPRFLEDVFRFGERYPSGDVFDFSDLKFVESTKKTLWNWFLDLLKVRGYFERTEPFAIRNISK